MSGDVQRLKAIVVFHTDGEAHWLGWLLKRGFGHCFVCLLLNGKYWVRFDGAYGVPVFDVIAGPDFDLAGYYRSQPGHTVLETVQGNLPIRGPAVVANCVGLVKTALCLRAPFVITPWGLYKTLRRCAREPGRSGIGQLLPGLGRIAQSGQLDAAFPNAAKASLPKPPQPFALAPTTVVGGTETSEEWKRRGASALADGPLGAAGKQKLG